MTTLTAPSTVNLPVAARRVAESGGGLLHPKLETNFQANLETDLARARWLANWLDTRFSFMGFRFGLEGLLGLIPLAGDRWARWPASSPSTWPTATASASPCKPAWP